MEKRKILPMVLLAAIILVSVFLIVTVPAIAQSTVTRNIEPDVVAPGGVVNVTISFTVPEELVWVMFTDIVPSGWTITDMATEPDDGVGSLSDSRVKFEWYRILPEPPYAIPIEPEKEVIASYKLHVPAEAGEEDYKLNGTFWMLNMTAGEKGGYTGGEDTVTVGVGPAPLKADADGPYYGNVSEPIQFYGSATGGTPPYSWLWGFGDGNASTVQNPTHAYAFAGDYTATLTVTDNVGDTASDTASVMVSPPIPPPKINAMRDISKQIVNPGETFTVTVVVNTIEDVFAPILDEDTPTGWTVTEIENAGATYKASEVKWLWTGMWSAGTTKTVIYNVTVPSDAEQKDYWITGNISAYGVDPTAVEGESKVSVGPQPPYIVEYTITNTTISPDDDGYQDTTDIDVRFSEQVACTIAIENVTGVIKTLYTSSGVTDPAPKTWDGTDENGIVVQDGIYTVNITMQSTTTGLTAFNNSRTITVAVAAQVIAIYEGWNLISTPISPSDTFLLSVMASVGADNWTSVWSYDVTGWHRYDKEGPPFLNDLTEMDAGIGYWVEMSADDTLTITGSPPVVTSIDLAAGWNLVGYNSQVSMATLTALASLGDDWVSVWTYDETGWHRYDKEGPPFLNDLTEMSACKGYWIEMCAAGMWTI